MGLLDRWLKKKTAAQLNRESSVNRDVVEGAKPAKESPAQEAPLEAKKSPKPKAKSAVKKAEKTETVKPVKKTDVFPENKNQNVKNQVYHKIIAPLVTEKTNLLQAYNQYVFEVARDATKEQVKNAIKELYGITPLAINMINVQGKFVRFGRRQGRRSDFKKAIITVPSGSSIKINETV